MFKRGLKTALVLMVALSSMLPQGFFERPLPQASAEAPFTDVESPFAYTEAIVWAKENDIVKGYEDGSFKPDQTVNRVEALTMALRLADFLQNTAEANRSNSASSELTLKTSPARFLAQKTFTDVDEKAWYADALEVAVEAEIVKGVDDDRFEPARAVNRAEAVKMLVRATKKTQELPNIASDPWYAPYLEYAKQKALLIPNREGDYLPAQELSRGEFAELLYRFVKTPYTSTVEYGIASYYGRSYDGHNTASGKALDTDGFMCAHKSLPFGTKLRVTNVDSLKSVIVEVVDRGPYTKGYVVDLTPTAFEVLEPLSAGLSQVRIEVLK